MNYLGNFYSPSQELSWATGLGRWICLACLGAILALAGCENGEVQPELQTEAPEDQNGFFFNNLNEESSVLHRTQFAFRQPRFIAGDTTGYKFAFAGVSRVPEEISYPYYFENTNGPLLLISIDNIDQAHPNFAGRFEYSDDYDAPNAISYVSLHVRTDNYIQFRDEEGFLEITHLEGQFYRFDYRFRGFMSQYQESTHESFEAPFEIIGTYEGYLEHP